MTGTSAYTRLVSGVLFPLHEFAKRHSTVQIRKELECSQWWAPDRIEQLQLARLRRLLQCAGKEVPYYRRLFKELDIEPEDVASLQDLSRIPFLTKKVIRENFQDLRADRAKDLTRFTTGGSSGEPLIFYIGKERVSHDVAAKWRATRWWGVDIGDPEVVVWGSPIELGAQDRLRALRDRVLRTHLIAAFEMSPDNLDRFIREIRRIRPKMLFGYPSALAHIARHAERSGQLVNDLGVRVAFVTSERLYEDQRADIGRIFGCQVANGYGGRDAGFIAHECAEGGMHITAEDVVVEVIGGDDKPLPPGQAGEVVITHLATRDYPFIRYRTGDVAVLSQNTCSCGRGLPLLAEVQGRTTDFVVAHDGTVMHGLALIYVIREVEGVEQFKIVQENRVHTRILLVTNDRFTPESHQRVKKGMEDRLGAGVRVEIQEVNEIPREASGKYRYVVSKVALEGHP